MKNKENEEDKQVEPLLESTDEIQKQIEGLQAKYNKALALEEEESVEHIELPVADIMLKVGHGNQIPKHGVTPPEVAILASIHHALAGGCPVSQVRPTGVVKIDPLDLRRILVGKYSKDKVMALFPGPLPNFPTRFARAVKLGMETEVKVERLMDFHLSPSAATA